MFSELFPQSKRSRVCHLLQNKQTETETHQGLTRKDALKGLLSVCSSQGSAKLQSLPCSREGQQLGRSETAKHPVSTALRKADCWEVKRSSGRNADLRVSGPATAPQGKESEGRTEGSLCRQGQTGGLLYSCFELMQSLV